MTANIKKCDFIGKWQITEIDQWSQADNYEVDYIEFNKNDMGESQIGCMFITLDCRFVQDQRGPVIDFTFEGNDECDPIFGRGTVIMVPKGLAGQICIHCGEEINFVAKRYQSNPVKKRGKAK